MLFAGTLVALILLLVLACGAMVYKVYASRGVAPPARAPRTVSAALPFAEALTELLREQLRELPDPAIRFALQSRIDAAILMGDTARSLALLEVFFDLERLENETLTPEAIARFGGLSLPVASLLGQPPAVREARLAGQLADQVRRQLGSVVGTKRAALDFNKAGPLPTGDEACLRWYSDGSAQDWFNRITQQAQYGIGSANMAGLIEVAARKLGQTVPLACFPNLLAVVPAECLTLEKTYAAGRSVLWNDFLEARRSLQASQIALTTLNDELEERVRVRTAELEAAKLRAEESERAKDRFLANMSHELRTPLNAIIGFSEILTDRLFGDLNERQSKYIQNVLVSGRHLLRLINDILDLSKVEAGRITLELVPFDAGEALRDVHTIVKTLANTKGITLSFEISPELPEVTADLQKFKQIMYNLLSNAIKFTRPGGLVTTTASITTFDEGPSEPLLRVSVKDTGIGIKPSDHERIFGEFEQVDSSYGREQQGTGLGLALTKQLVRLHGGRIWLQSEEGKGSTFAFVIPVNADTRPEGSGASAEAPFPAARQQPGRPTVIVAEDDPNASELLTQYVSSAGYAVKHAFDGEEAVAIAREIHPSAITLDIMLPKKDGWSVLADLKSHPATKAIPVIIVSITDDRQLGFSLGAADFLLKPVNKEQLAEVLDRAVAAAAKRIRTILVVDDEPATVEFVGDVLHAHGVETLKAYGGEEGVAMALEHRPDAIILDLMMPEVTGFDVVRRLREDAHAREIPILILTAKDLTHDERLELNRNVQAIASKAGREELLRELARLERAWQ